MSQRLFVAIARNDKRTFLGLVQEKKSLLKARTNGSQSTVLHLASKFGNNDLVSEIIKLCPDMVSAENIRKETPLHEACRRGNANIVMLLLQTNPWVASALSHDNQSAFSLACSSGHLDVVKLILNQPWLMDIEEDRIDLTCLHRSILNEHTSVDIVKAILEARPNFARKTDKDGCSPLHYACQRGHLEIARILLELAPDIALQFNNEGYTPLHLAAMNGEVAILFEFMSGAPTSFKFPTKEAETVFHLAVKSGKYAAFTSMASIFKNTNLFHQLDQYGNTVLHVAVSKGCYTLAEYVINETKVDLNHRNHEGHTALDLLTRARVTSETERITDMLVKSGGKKSTDASLLSLEIDTFGSTQVMTPESLRDALEHRFDRLPKSMMNSGNYTGNKSNNQPEMDAGNNHKTDGLHQVEEVLVVQDKKYEIGSSSRKEKWRQRHKKELNELQRIRRNRQYKTYREALQNARNTIILVAILIASVTFNVGLNPPGGVHQDGSLLGQSTVGRKVAFKIFVLCNSVALFTSLCIVIVLVSVIPFQRKKLMRLMMITHKVMWVAVAFMATAYAAAAWVILPHGHGTKWMIEALLAISAGTIATVFVYLLVQLARHMFRKSKWKKEKSKKMKVVDVNVDIESHPSKSSIEGKIQPQPAQFNNEIDVLSESTNSDVDSASSFGYHPY